MIEEAKFTCKVCGERIIQRGDNNNMVNRDYTQVLMTHESIVYNDFEPTEVERVFYPAADYDKFLEELKAWQETLHKP